MSRHHFKKKKIIFQEITNQVTIKNTYKIMFLSDSGM